MYKRVMVCDCCKKEFDMDDDVYERKFSNSCGGFGGNPLQTVQIPIDSLYYDDDEVTADVQEVELCEECYMKLYELIRTNLHRWSYSTHEGLKDETSEVDPRRWSF